METFLINYRSKIIGVYTDLDQAKLFINSCLYNNLMVGTAEILVFTTNSCYCINKINVTLDKPETTIEDIKPKIEPKKEVDYNDPAIVKLAENKVMLQHKINMLKVQKDRINESKEIYDSDLKLYNIFKKNLSDNNKFIIPELFKDKFNILKRLDDENRLNWDNFFKEYNHNNIYGDYFKLNSYEEAFIDSDKKNDLSEEFELESDTEASISEASISEASIDDASIDEIN